MHSTGQAGSHGLRGGRLLPLDAAERLLEPSLAQVSPEVLDGLPAAAEGVGDLLIGPAGSIRIGLQQDLGAANLLAGALELPDDPQDLFTFPLCQTNDVYFA
ncbi:MAG TPA: hypothetical protein VHD56_17750, partial [Tepidisphaeraceae bacterium]|nr:hypothetical protein [Tepidisphaeraceae bacterium]